MSKILALSNLIVDNEITSKIDLIGKVFIGCQPFFNVYRRYNSVYEIVLEDVHGDTHLQKDCSIRQSLSSVLCLSEHRADAMYSDYVTSIAHNGSAPMTVSDAVDILDMYWSNIQVEFSAIYLYVGGLDFPSTPQDEVVDVIECPSAPSKPPMPEDVKPTQEELDSARALLALRYYEAPPQTAEPQTNEEAKPQTNEETKPQTNEEFPPLVRSEVVGSKRRICHCDYEEQEQEQEQEHSYTRLRNGRCVRKRV